MEIGNLPLSSGNRYLTKITVPGIWPAIYEALMALERLKLKWAKT